MTTLKKATFSGKTQLAAKYMVSSVDGSNNRVADIKRRVWRALPQSL